MSFHTTVLGTDYPIYIAPNLLQTKFFDQSILAGDADIVIIADDFITDNSVYKLAGRWLRQKRPHVISINSREDNKNIELVYDLVAEIEELGLSNIVLLAIGGGLLLDIAAFVASSLPTKVPCILMPTTLVGMVSCATGKVLINSLLPPKQYEYSFQPKAVWIDVSFLETLNHDELADGLVFMLRLAVLFDKSLCEQISLIGDSVESIALDSWTDIIATCIRLNLQASESAASELLNFGELMAARLLQSHNNMVGLGQALLIGMAIEIKVLSKLGLMSQSCLELILRSISSIQYQNPFEIDEHLLLDAVEVEELLEQSSSHVASWWQNSC